jgi:hypothetical protein
VRKLDAESRLEYARAAVAVLRALKITKSTMHHADFAKAIGLISASETFQQGHRAQITNILDLAHIAEATTRGGQASLDFTQLLGKGDKPSLRARRAPKRAISPRGRG